MPALAPMIPRDRLFLCDVGPLATARQASRCDDSLAGIVAASRQWGDAAWRQSLADNLLRHRQRLLGVECLLDLRAADSAAAVASPGLLPDESLVLLRLVSSDAHDKPSAPRALPAAAALVSELAAALPRQPIVLDHRAGDWLCRIEDGVRLLMRVYRANVGVALNLSDWQQTDGDPARLGDAIRLAAPKLLAVSVDVTCREMDGPAIAVPPVLAAAMPLLEQAGYSGPFILRCKGDDLPQGASRLGADAP